MKLYARPVTDGYAHATAPVGYSQRAICPNPETDDLRSSRAANSLTLLGNEPSNLFISGDGVGILARRNEFQRQDFS